MPIAPKMLSLCRRVLRTTWYFAYRTCWASFRPISPWKRATLFWQALRLGWVQSKTVTRSPGKLQEWPISHSTWLKGRDVNVHYHVCSGRFRSKQWSKYSNFPQSDLKNFLKQDCECQNLKVNKSIVINKRLMEIYHGRNNMNDHFVWWW